MLYNEKNTIRGASICDKVAQHMKTALVLSGGGAKGAYEAGCVRALQEIGYEFDLVCGTSIGALNGLLVAQKDFDPMYRMWEELSIEQVMQEPLNLDLSLDSIISQKNLIPSFFRSYLNENGADIGPLIKLIHSLYDPQRLRKSGVQYGLVTVAFPDLKPVEITAKELSDDEVVEYALASASCFPAFPVHKIGEQGFIDGGYYDNLPISLARRMGAQQMIVIELEETITHPVFAGRPDIRLLRPSWGLGGFLDFNRDALDFRTRLGYLDAMKQFGEYSGYRYAFDRADITDDKALPFYNAVLDYEEENSRGKLFTTKDLPLTNYLRALAKNDTLALTDYLLLGVENAMEIFEFSNVDVYDFRDVQDQLMQHFEALYQEREGTYNKKLEEIAPSRYLELLKKINSKEVVGYFYNDMVRGRQINYTNIFIQGYLLKEYLCALYFYVQTK